MASRCVGGSALLRELFVPLSVGFSLALTSLFLNGGFALNGIT